MRPSDDLARSITRNAARTLSLAAMSLGVASAAVAVGTFAGVMPNDPCTADPDCCSGFCDDGTCG